MRRLRRGLLTAAALQFAILLFSAVALRADANCGVECDAGGSVTCSVSGSGCTCHADSSPGGGCSAACASGPGATEPDEQECPDLE